MGYKDITRRRAVQRSRYRVNRCLGRPAWRHQVERQSRPEYRARMRQWAESSRRELGDSYVRDVLQWPTAPASVVALKRAVLLVKRKFPQLHYQ